MSSSTLAVKIVSETPQKVPLYLLARKNAEAGNSNAYRTGLVE